MSGKSSDIWARAVVATARHTPDLLFSQLKRELLASRPIKSREISHPDFNGELYFASSDGTEVCCEFNKGKLVSVYLRNPKDGETIDLDFNTDLFRTNTMPLIERSLGFKLRF